MDPGNDYAILLPLCGNTTNSNGAYSIQCVGESNGQMIISIYISCTAAVYYLMSFHI